MTLALRRATQADSARLLAWRNDPATRANSIDAQPVTPAQHDAFLARSLAAADRALFIVESDGDALGTVRFDRQDATTLEVSLTVAPEHRGHGHAHAFLQLAAFAARELGATRLVAVIRPDNAASRRAFERAGYRGFTPVEQRGVALVQCELELG